VDFFEKFATLQEKADRPRRRSIEELNFIRQSQIGKGNGSTMLQLLNDCH
jgi:hypothetical protein